MPIPCLRAGCPNNAQGTLPFCSKRCDNLFRFATGEDAAVPGSPRLREARARYRETRRAISALPANAPHDELVRLNKEAASAWIELGRIQREETD